MKHLFIDPGTRHCGLAKVLIDKTGVEIIEVSQVTNPHGGKGFPMYKAMLQALHDEIRDNHTDVTYIWIEQPTATRFPNVGLFFLVGGLCQMGVHSFFRVTDTLNPQTWTKGTKKSVRKKRLQEMFGNWQSWPGAERYDLRDAAGQGSLNFKKERGCGVYPDFMDAVGMALHVYESNYNVRK